MLGYSDDDLIRGSLADVRTIAMVGASPKPERPSYGVLEFLLAAGYRVFPVNPGHDGSRILGQLVYAKLADLTEPVDMIDVFRRPETLGPLVDEVLAMNPRPTVFWTQLGVVNPAATDRAAEAGLRVIVDRCPAIEYPRLIRRVSRAPVY
jgi:predicted CoA-binding protein